MPQGRLSPRQVLDRAVWWLGVGQSVRVRHARRKGKQQHPYRRSDLTNAIQGTHDVGMQMRRARAAARREGDHELATKLERASLALQRERRYLRRMLARTR